MLPFGREELEYIAALDAKADIRMLRAEVCAAWVAGKGAVWLALAPACIACLAAAVHVLLACVPCLPPACSTTVAPAPCLHPCSLRGCPARHPSPPQVPSLRVESLRVLEVCTTLLKECAAAGLTLTEIAGVVTRPLIGMEVRALGRGRQQAAGRQWDGCVLGRARCQSTALPSP